MKAYNTRKYTLKVQLLSGLLFVLVVSCACFLSFGILGYKAVALILLMTVSVLAMLFDIIPVLFSSVLSALIWNFFFIPPIYTFHISNTEDVLMFCLYFVIALVNAVLISRIRKEEKKNRDKEEKEKTIKLYNTLLNSLSHELRTPIATIISSADTLKENMNNLSVENRSEILTQIDIAAIRLNRQVENLLNMSRLESGTLKLNIEWTDVADLVFSTIQKLKPYAGKHILQYKPENNLPLCKLDAGIVEQVLHNILFNSLQYTPPGTAISVDTRIQNNILQIVIQDTGKGIPEASIATIFDKFYRLPDTNTGGTGLGLSIAKGFTEAHNGQVIAENIPSGGVKFTLSFPVEISYINNLKNE